SIGKASRSYFSTSMAKTSSSVASAVPAAAPISRSMRLRAALCCLRVLMGFSMIHTFAASILSYSTWVPAKRSSGCCRLRGARLDLPLEAIPESFRGQLKREVTLHIEPELGRGIEVPRQSQCRVAGDGATLGNDVLDAGDRHPDALCEAIGADPQRLHELLAQLLARVDRRKVAHRTQPRW